MAALVNNTDFSTLIVSLNSETGGWLAPMLLLTLFVISFFSLKFGTTPAKAGAASSFLAFVVVKLAPN